MRSSAEQLRFDQPQPLPDTPSVQRLIRVHDVIAPSPAQKYIKTKIHEVRRPNGEVGWQVVNTYKDGVSLLAYETVNGKLYLIMHDEMRYPLPREDQIHMTAEEAAASVYGAGRWSRENVSGAVEPGQSQLDAIITEAEAENGIVGLRPDQLHRFFDGPLYSSVGTNRQPFNLFYAEIEDGQWQPESARPDLEEGSMHLGAYSIDAVHEMLGKQIIEMSTTVSILGLVRVALKDPKLRRYVAV